MRNLVVRLFKFGAILTLLLALALVIAVAVLDDEHYEAALIWAAEHFLDTELTIEGDLSIDLGPTIALRIQGMHIQRRDGTFSATAADLSTELKTRPLLSKAFWLERLTIVGANVELERSSEQDAAERAGQVLDLPNIIIEQARLLDVTVAYRDAADELHRAQIDRLSIEDPTGEDAIAVEGRGFFNDQPIAMAGTLGAPGLLSDPTAAFPIDLQLHSGDLSINVAGSIADPVAGRGVDLHLQARDPDLSTSLALLGNGAPASGTLALEVNVIGNYDALALQRLELTLKAANSIDVRAVGDIADLQTLSGIALTVSGRVDDAEIWQWLTVGKLRGIQRGQFSGALTGDARDLRVTDMSLEMTASSDLVLALRGHVEVDLKSGSLGDSALDLALTLAAPKLAAIGPLVDRELPAFGPVRLATRLTGGSSQVRFEGLKATIGGEPDHQFIFTDGSGDIVFEDGPTLRNVRLPMRATTPRPAGVSRLFGTDIPELGPTVVTGTWKIDNKTVALTAFESTIELAGGSTHRLSGDIQHRIGATTTADIRFDLDTDRLLALWLDETPGELGRVAGSVDLLRHAERWKVRHLDLQSADTDLFTIAVAGQKEVQTPGRALQTTLRLRVEDPPLVFETAGVDLPSLAPIDAIGTLTLNDGQYRYRGDLAVGGTRSHLDLLGTLVAGRPSFEGVLKTATLTLEDLGLGAQNEPTIPADEIAQNPDTERPTEDLSPSETAAPNNAPLFNREPFDLHWLNDFDLDLTVTIDALRGVDLEIDDIQGRITLASGLLRFSQADFEYLGGSASGTYELDARDTPGLKLDIRVEDFNVGNVIGEFLTDTFEGGVLDLEFRLEGQGHSPHELASSLDGEVAMVFENTTMPATYVQFLFADVFGWTISRTALAGGRSRISCGLVRLDVDAGKVSSSALLVDGPELTIGGDIRLDLGAETIDTVVLPRQKKHFSVFRRVMPVRINGSLRDPTVKAIPAGAAAQRVGGLLLLPQVFIPLEAVSQVAHLWSRHIGRGKGCTEVLGRSVEDGFAFEGVAPPNAVTPDE